MLPAVDVTFLESKSLNYTVVSEAGMICVMVSQFALPSGLNTSNADLLLRLSPGYPDVPPDMWWFSPAVLRADGSCIVATELTEHYLGRNWQRWSRHLGGASQWMSGIDSLESYFALITSELRKAAQRAA